MQANTKMLEMILNDDNGVRSYVRAANLATTFGEKLSKKSKLNQALTRPSQLFKCANAF